MRALKKGIVTLTAAVFLLLLYSVSCFAESIPYNAYTYDEWGNAVESSAGMEPTARVDGTRLGVGELNAPEAMFYHKSSEKLYIADTGNNRIVIAEKEFKSATSINSFLQADGTAYTLNAPKGIFVSQNGSIYISDTGNNRVLILNSDFSIRTILAKPDSAYFTEAKSFLPKSIVADKTGVIYVVSEGIYNGAVMLNEKNEFLGFFGSNKVEVTLQVRMNKIWKRLLSEKQSSKIAQYIPIEMSALTIDSEDMIYSCTLQNSSVTESIRKINSYGTNILDTKVTQSFQKGFGDLKSYIYDTVEYSTKFADLAVSEDGFISALDFTTGRVFQYDASANLLFVFGGLGNQTGNFQLPSAIETVGDNLLVLDRGTNTVTVFSYTEFGNIVLKAISLYKDGNYKEALEPWKKVLQYNSNFNLAYIGLGKAYLEQGNYTQAMTSFLRGNYKIGYNEAYKESRSIALRKYFPLIAAVLLLLLLFAFRRSLPVVRRRFRKVSRDDERHKNGLLYKWRIAFETALHPIDGYSEMYYKKSGSIGIAAIIAVLFFFLAILQFRYYGFQFCGYDKDKINILFLFVQTTLLCFLFTSVNWSFCTLFDGEGRLKDIWIAVNYSLLPYLFAKILELILSNFLVTEEGMFLSIVRTLGLLWSGFLLVKALEACHRYTLKITLISIFVSILGLFVLTFVFVLILSLSQQIFAFFVTVIKELLLR